ncbi:MAG TPA: hypothetical protein VIO15_05650 [Bacteroidales bacterium]
MGKIILYTIVACLVLLGCEPKDNTPHTIASGHVYSSGSGKPIAGVTIYMYDGLPYSNKGSSRMDSTKTDSTGYFHIELDGEEPVLLPYKENYSFTYAVGGAAIGIMPLESGISHNNIAINLDGEAGFNPILMNRVDMTYEEKVIISVYSKWGDPYGTLTKWGNGPHEYTNYLPKGELVLGDSYVRYKLEVTRSNVMNTFMDSVFIATGTVYRDTIWY